MSGRGNEARARLDEAMARLAGGERAALEEVYRLTHVKLFGICLRILADRKEAEDALQEVYVNLWRRAARFDPARASPISWLATFARNAAIDRLRRGKAMRGTEPIEAADGIASDSPAADELLIEAERNARIHHCLDALEPNQRAAIRTAFFEGRTYAELAAAQDTPLGTVKSWIRRGLMRLKTCLEGGE